MEIIREIASYPDIEALTIGFFDGVHAGHQVVLKNLKRPSACLTFTNHPSTLFTPKDPTPLICTTEQRVHLLEQAGIDLLILLDFTRELSEQSAKTFLLNIRKQIPFKHLVLGHDAHIGHKREGTVEVISNIAKNEGFHLEYVDPILYNDKPISSTEIRNAIKQGNLDLTKTLLGRPLSYLGPVIEGPHIGREVGYPTANMPLPNLVLPPFGVYAITLTLEEKTYTGVANIGVAPTLHEHRGPMLEVYLFNFNQPIYGRHIEVTLHHFIRPEKKFPSKEALKTQIASDILTAKQKLNLDESRPL